MAGIPVRPEAQAIVDECKDFVRAMQRVEQSLGTTGATLSKEDREAVLREVLAFMQSPEVAAPYTREIARELIGQLFATAAYADYKGSTDYIQ